MGIVIEMPPVDATLPEVRQFCQVNDIEHHHKNGMATLRNKISRWLEGFQRRKEVHDSLIWLKRRNHKVYKVLEGRIRELESGSHS